MYVVDYGLALTDHAASGQGQEFVSAFFLRAATLADGIHLSSRKTQVASLEAADGDVHIEVIDASAE